MPSLAQSVVSAATILAAGLLFAADSPGQADAPPVTPVLDGVQVETLLTGLRDPSGIAVRPGGTGERFELFISEAAAGRVVSISTAAPEEIREVITGCTQHTVGSQPGSPLGRLPLFFLNSRTLVVGDVAEESGRRLAHIYDITADRLPLAAEQVKQSLQSAHHFDRANQPLAPLLVLAANQDALFLSLAGTSLPDGILRAKIGGDLVGLAETFVDSSSVDGAGVPSGLVIDRKMGKGYLVVAHLGNVGQELDSGLTFYNPYSGQLLLNLAVQLVDMVGLAYSPRTGLLYTLDASFVTAGPGGVFRLDSALADTEPPRQTCQAIPIVRLHRPTAFVFGPDQALYVAALGPTDSETDSPPGMVVRITGDL